MKDPKYNYQRDPSALRYARGQRRINILGASSIDETIIALFPSIIDINEANRIKISEIINAYIFKAEIALIAIIEEIFNHHVADFIAGLRIIAVEENIKNIQELDKHIKQIKNNIINTDNLCRPSDQEIKS